MLTPPSNNFCQKIADAPDIPREAIETSRNYLRRKAILSAADVVCDSNSGVGH
jgi:hypothetical protein